MSDLKISIEASLASASEASNSANQIASSLLVAIPESAFS